MTSTSRSHDCLDDATVAALARGTISREGRRRALAHLDGCASCRALVAETAALLRDPAVETATREISARTRTSSLNSQFWRKTGLAAAAAILLAVTLPRFVGNDDVGYRLRDDASTRAAAPAIVAPAGPVAAPRSLVWTRPKGAGEFRVTLFDFEGKIVWESSVQDTVAVFPESVKLLPGARYFWKVEAQLDFGRSVSSRLQEFRISTPSAGR